MRFRNRVPQLGPGQTSLLEAYLHAHLPLLTTAHSHYRGEAARRIAVPAESTARQLVHYPQILLNSRRAKLRKEFGLRVWQQEVRFRTLGTRSNPGRAPEGWLGEGPVTVAAHLPEPIHHQL